MDSTPDADKSLTDVYDLSYQETTDIPAIAQVVGANGEDCSSVCES